MKTTKNHTLIHGNVKYGTTSFSLRKLIELREKSPNTIIIFDPYIIPLDRPVQVKLTLAICALYLKQFIHQKNTGDQTK